MILLSSDKHYRHHLLMCCIVIVSWTTKAQVGRNGKQNIRSSLLEGKYLIKFSLVAGQFFSNLEYKSVQQICYTSFSGAKGRQGNW